MARHFDDRYAEPVEEINLGPDERDMDLIDGSWEGDHYAGRHKRRDWQNIGLAFGLLIVVAMILPGILVMFR